MNDSLLNPQLSLNPLSDYHELVAFSFMVHALEAGTIVAVMASLAGWFMVLRRETFAGHTLAVMSFPGASGAALLGAPLALGYYVACGLAAALIAFGSRMRGVRSPAQESGLIGTVQVGALALGFLFLSLYQGVLEDLETLLFGSFLGITEGQVETLFAVAVLTLGFLLLAGRPLLFGSLDEPVAEARGVPVRMLHICFLVLLGLAVAATAQMTGALLVFALLVAPAAAAQKLTVSIPLSLLLSVVIALLVTWVGLALSYFTNDSVGFFISTLAFAVYVLASARERFGRRIHSSRRPAEATALA